MATEKAHETGLAGRYANAVFELAQEQDVVDAVAADFATLKAAMAASSEAASFCVADFFCGFSRAESWSSAFASGFDNGATGDLARVAVTASTARRS